MTALRSVAIGCFLECECSMTRFLGNLQVGETDPYLKLHRRPHIDLLDVQPAELIVDTVENKLIGSFGTGFLIPDRHTSVVGFNLDSVVFGGHWLLS